MVWESPAESLAGVGAIGAVEASGPDRFEEVRDRVAALMERCSFGGPSNEVGWRPLFALGGFAFTTGGTGWPGFRESLFYLPERTFCHRPVLDTVETRWTITDVDRAAR